MLPLSLKKKKTIAKKSKQTNETSKTNKTKQKTPAKQKQKMHKNTWSPFRFGLPWSVSDIPRDTPLEKVDSPFPSSYPLQRASWL